MKITQVMSFYAIRMRRLFWAVPEWLFQNFVKEKKKLQEKEIARKRINIE